MAAPGGGTLRRPRQRLDVKCHARPCARLTPPRQPEAAPMRDKVRHNQTRGRRRPVIGERPLERDNEHNDETHATPVVDAFAAASTVGVAVICWVIAVHEMEGMNMGVATTLGSFSFFIAAWVSMMAAMMLQGALPAARGTGRGSGGL